MSKILGHEHGYIAVYDCFKGYGFIRRASGKDLFFHLFDFKNFKKDEKFRLIVEGDLVQFKIISQNSKSDRAIEIEFTDEL